MTIIHIFGASGSGTSTLGQALAKELGLTWLDTDNYYWLPSDPPFQEKRPIPQRVEMIKQAFAENPQGCVLSGALESWGHELVPYFDAAIFVRLEKEERLKRLKERGIKRYGDRALPGGDMYENEQEFIAWAAHYEDSTQTGRNLKRHLAFIETLPCPILELDSMEDPQKLTEKAVGFVRGIA